MVLVALFSVTISSGSNLQNVLTVTTAGTGYTFAYIRDVDIVVVPNVWWCRIRIKLERNYYSKGGHGKDVVKELGGFFVMLNKSLVGIEGTSDIGVVNDFRRIGLVKN